MTFHREPRRQAVTIRQDFPRFPFRARYPFASSLFHASPSNQPPTTLHPPSSRGRMRCVHSQGGTIWQRRHHKRTYLGTHGGRARRDRAPGREARGRAIPTNTSWSRWIRGVEPVDFLSKRIEKQHLDRIPRVTVDDDRAEWMVTEGIQPTLVKPGRDAVKHLIAREADEEPDSF